VPDALPDFDLDAIADPALRALVAGLLNLREQDCATLRALQEENQRLRDEIARLKGEHGQPKPPANRSNAPDVGNQDHSSEAERRQQTPRKPWQKGSKRDQLEIDRTEVCPWTDPLPPGAVFEGYHTTVFQDLVIRRDNVAFRREKYWDPRTRVTYLAPLPTGYVSGEEFGPGLRTSALTLVHQSHLTLPAFHRLATGAGVRISRGKIASLVTEGLERFHAEQRAVWEAGLRSSPWQQTDVTSTRVNGRGFACHVLTNPLYTCYLTAPHQDRAAVVDLLRGGAAREYRLDETTLALLAQWKLPQWACRRLTALRAETTWSAAAFTALLGQHLPTLGPEQRRKVETAALIAAYRAAPHWPVASCLLTDDAGVYPDITAERALCWVHDARHYTKLTPLYACFQKQVAAFRDDYWEFYGKLRAYREAPSPAQAATLEAEFDGLFSREVTYCGLAECVARTRANKEALLRVLVHPELPLHNNEAELAARRRVRKRDVSFGPRSPAGMRAWDTLQGLVETTRKLGVQFAAYVEDRIRGSGKIPPLAELIRQKAAELSLGTSWSPA
jgi:hypothetical protein